VTSRTIIKVGGVLLLGAYACFTAIVIAVAPGGMGMTWFVIAYNALLIVAGWRFARRRLRGDTGPDIVADPRSSGGRSMLAPIHRPSARLDVESYVPRDRLEP
jgi:membrane protein implicated in regulation of membrane protease activity